VGGFFRARPRPVLPKWLYLSEAADAFKIVRRKLSASRRRGISASALCRRRRKNALRTRPPGTAARNGNG